MIRATVFLAALAGIAGHASAAQPVELQPGAAQVFRVAGPLARIVVGKAGVIDAIPTGDRGVRITALAGGETSLSLFGESGQPLGSYSVRVAGAEREIAAEFRREPGLESIDVDRMGEKLVLRGSVPDQDTHQRATSIAKAYAGDGLTDLTSITGRQMVAVDVRFAAVSAGTLKALGFNFSKLGGDIQGALAAPDSLGGISLPNTGVPAPFDLDITAPIQSAFNLILSNPANGITGVLSALSSAGLSEILAQPTLLVRSGEEASFLAGGDVPVPVPQGGNTNGAVAIEYREFGVRLNVAAQVLSDKRIVLKLTPEVSELDYANGVRMQGYLVPGLRRRTATTTVELGSGQSFVIAGLNYSSSNVASEKVPLLAEIPVIGSLFRRTRNAQERQELVIVATPRLVSPLEADEAVRLPGATDRPFDPGFGAMLGGRAIERRVDETGRGGKP